MCIRTRRERLQTRVARTFPRMALQSEVMRGASPGMLASLLGKTGIRVIKHHDGVAWHSKQRLDHFATPRDMPRWIRARTVK